MTSLVPMYRAACSWRIAAPLLMTIATTTAPGEARLAGSDASGNRGESGVERSDQQLPLTDDSVGHVGGPGKFKVGHTMIQIVHTSSTDEDRPIDVMVWYPANTKDWRSATPSIYRSRLWGVPLIPGTWDPLGF